MPSDPAGASSAVERSPSLVRRLTLLDAVMLLVGGIIGSGIFLTAADIAANVRTPLVFLLVWVVGGAITLLACFAFAELGAMFPDSGGQYVFLREAYGDLAAFLYGWMIFSVSVTGTAAALATGFAEYLDRFAGYGASTVLVQIGTLTVTRGHLMAIAAIAFLTFINIVGVKRAALFIAAATWAKIAAIAAFIMFGLLIGRGSWGHVRTAVATPIEGSAVAAFGVALIAVFWALDGWVYVTWAAGELQDPQRNLPRAMVIGICTVVAIYLAINVVYVYALPMAEIASELTIAQAAATVLFSPAAGHWMSLLVAVSCFGALSAALLAGARVYYAMGRDRLFFRRMAEVHPRWRTPAFSLLAQFAWSVGLTVSGRYDQLFTYVMFMMVLSYVATVAAVFVLRRKRPDLPRPYRCTGYPVLPAIYIVVGSIFTINAIWQRPLESAAGTAIVLAGIPGFLWWRRQQPLQRG